MNVAPAPLELEPVRWPGRGPLHVAIVDEELPYPATSGKRIRTLNLTLRLARRHRITYLCHRNADDREARQAAIFLADHGVATVLVDRAVPRKSGAGFYARLAANLFSRLPYSVATHTSRPLRRAIRRHAASQRVDLWHCEWTPYAQALQGVPGRHLVMAHNVESLIWQRYSEAETNPFKRWYIRRQWHKYERFERRAFAWATRTVAVSPEDAVLMHERFNAPRVDVVDNGVATDYFQPAGRPRDFRRILYLGSLDWRPNLDAVRLLLDDLFPAVRTQEPEARLVIVGRNPPDWLRRQTARTPHAELHADVADVRPFLHECGILAVPLRIGGGSRLKILEALACRTPVVATRVGAEGLCLEPEQHLTVVDRPEEMVAALVHAVRHPEIGLAQAEAGRQVVLERYDWDVLADRLEEVWLRCAGRTRETNR